MKYLKCLLLIGILHASMGSTRAQETYVQRFSAWHAQREAALKAEDGWLNLAGRFVLPTGRSSFGAAKTNRIVFPAGKSADWVGDFLLRNDSVWAVVRPEVSVALSGQPFLGGTVLLYPVSTPTWLQSGSLRWFVIRRGEQFIVRLRDLEHPALSAFHGVPTYPLDTVWRFRARFEPTVGKKIPITNVLGQTNLQDSPGALVFEYGGSTHRLDAIQEGNELFLIFADETNGLETYGTGRFLYADLPDSTSYTVLDFNYAINPPCAFTDFATCPLPPKQNVLPFAVKAGELSVATH